MSTSTFTPEQIEAAIISEQNRIIAATCQKHGVHPSQLTEAQTADARRSAEDIVSREAARRANPLFPEMEHLREKLAQAEAEVLAVRTAKTSAASATTTRQITVEEARRRMGEMAWNHQLDDRGRLQAIGIDPSAIDAVAIQQIKECFGSAASSSRASDLFKSNPSRYRMLREAGRALRLI